MEELGDGEMKVVHTGAGGVGYETIKHYGRSEELKVGPTVP